ncbi:MAG: hypothetical protein JNK82_31920, partial [Myxococcaceae bacterium]|nr:hypothetical protein [Myxococcaceae bacterium]
MKVRMRFVLVIFSITIGGCLCTPSTPKAVTLRLKNTSRDTLFVDTTSGQLGMEVQRNVSGSWLTFAESPRCSCLTCDAVCGGCTCAEPERLLVQRVPPGSSFERSWAGVVQLESTRGCGGFGSSTACLAGENAPYNEAFNLHLCYALTATITSGPPTDGGVEEGTLPTDRSCVDRTFTIDDGVAEIGPQRGADCVTTADCKGDGEMCFSGACTASCPANTFPSEAESSLRVAVDDRGFFTTVQTGSKITYTGSGTVGSASYNASSLRIFLTRTGGGGETLTATLDLDVPKAMHLGPLSSGQKVTVKVIDNSTLARPASNTGFVIRDDTGALLVVADSGLGSPNLAAADLAPFTATFQGAPVGCRVTACGKQLFQEGTFGDGSKTVELGPGQSANLVNTAGTFRAVNVFGGDYGASGACETKTIRP